MALGSYDASPLDMAGAYTTFANNGVRLSPILLRSVRNGKGDVIANYTTDQRQVLDPRVAYVMTNMMEGVINNGLGYTAVRLRGFTPPAAGKTGSSHDGWFAGYTSNLLCIVWVGYDDYSDLRLSGAMTAAPIWTEFMKKAAVLPQYADMKAFQQPTGVVDVQLDKVTNRLATPTCPDDYVSAFVAGTEPRDTCDAQEGMKGFFSRMFGGDKPAASRSGANARRRIGQDPNNPQDLSIRKRRGSLARLREYLRMTKRRLRCLNQQTAGRMGRIEGDSGSVRGLGLKRLGPQGARTKSFAASPKLCQNVSH